jgi:hypothetical protein
MVATPGELHVGALDLAAGEVFFGIEVEADEPENDGNGLGVSPGVLDSVNVNNVLVDEFRVAQFQGIGGQQVVEVLVGDFGLGRHGNDRGWVPPIDSICGSGQWKVLRPPGRAHPRLSSGDRSNSFQPFVKIGDPIIIPGIEYLQKACGSFRW